MSNVKGCIVSSLIASILAIQGTSLASETNLDVQRILAETTRTDREIIDPAVKRPVLTTLLERAFDVADRKRLAAMADADILALYRIALTAVFYSFSPPAAERMREAWDELARREITPQQSHDEMVAAYVAARMFAQARAFAEEHSVDVTRKPPVFAAHAAKPGEISLLEVDASGTTLEGIGTPLLSGRRIVVVTSPWCHFSVKAMNEIVADEDLARDMRDANWLLPQHFTHDFSKVAEWNTARPYAQMKIIYRNADLPFLESIATPSFYFLEDGVPVDSFSGWHGASDMRKLKRIASKFADGSL